MVRDFRAIRTFELQWKEMQNHESAVSGAEPSMEADLNSRLDDYIQAMEEDDAF